MPLQPSALKALLDDGLAYHHAGRLDEALRSYEQAVGGGAGAPGHDLLGVALLDLNRSGEAEREFRRALAWEPSRAASLGHLGNARKVRRGAADAIAAYRRALAVAAEDPLWQRNLGLVLLAAGVAHDAVVLLRDLVDRRPQEAEGYNDLGLAIASTSSLREAERSFRAAATLDPGLPEVVINLALARIADRDPASAEIWARRALARAPASPNAMNALAAASLASERPATARRWLRSTVSLQPDMGEAHYNLGLMSMGLMDLNGAETAEKRALAIRPSHVEAEWNLALVRLLAGDFVRGWRDYESRWRMRDFPTPLRPVPQPSWEGESLDGRRILLRAEQGLGDTLQFIRYAPLVAQRGGRVYVECQPSLRRLLERMESVEDVRAQGEALPPFDCHAPLLSLPRIFGTTLATVPRRVPYLSSPMDTAEPPGPPIIGFAWAGSSQHRRDHARSLPREIAIRVAEQLLRVPNARLVSLQLGERARDLEGIVPAGLTSSGDFLDTAAALSRMRLIVSVDTAVAHLAGALGLPTVLLLSCVPDFRWLLGRADSPWYPSLRLVRQSGPEDWNSILPTLRGAVAECLER